MDKKRAAQLNIGSMSADTKRALARFEAVTGLEPVRFKSNKEPMQYWFSVWIDRKEPAVQKAIRSYPDVKEINGMSYDVLIDDMDDEAVRFDIDRGDLL